MESNFKFTELISKTYKLIDIWPEGDPLKNKVKEKTLALTENLTKIFSSFGWVSLRDYLSKDRQKSCWEAVEDIEVLEIYLKIAKNQGWLEEINFLILTQKYNEIKNQVSLKIGKTSLNVESLGDELKNPKAGKEEALKVDKIDVVEKYSSRQKKIMELIIDREKTQVSDIIKSLPDVTKRTIRRDLDDLLKKGKITRSGQFNNVFYHLSDRTH